MAKFKNITEGPKGVNAADGRLLFIAPGTDENIDVSEGELASATRTGWFEISGDPLDHDEDGKKGGSKAVEPVSLTSKNKAELLDIAKAEGVEIEEGATNADIVSAIELAREG